MTKYLADKNKIGIRNDTPIPISKSRYESSSNSIEDSKEYFCNNCQRLLRILNKDTGEYICVKCTISYYPEHQEVRSTHKLITPEGVNAVDREIAVSFPPVQIGWLLYLHYITF